MSDVKKTILAALALSVAVSGCLPQGPVKRPVAVNIAFQSWVGYGLFYLARDMGFDRDEGISLNIADEEMDFARYEAFKAGMLDCEAATLDLLIEKTARGLPIYAMMIIDESSGSDAVVARSGINAVKDLAGKRIAMAKGDVGDTFLSCLLRKNGMRPEDIIAISAEPDKVAEAFLDRIADACVTWEPHVTEALRRPGARIITSTKEHPGIIVDTLNVRAGFLAEHPDAAKAVMRCWFRALSYYREKPVEASALISGYYVISADEYRRQVKGLKWIDYGEQSTDERRGKMAEVISTIADIKESSGRIERRPDPAAIMDFGLLGKLYEDSE